MSSYSRGNLKAGRIHWIGLLLACSVLVPARAEEARPGAGSHHPLWVVEGKTNVVYLLGSIHLLKPEDYPLSPVIESAFTNSRLIVFETDIELMQSPVTQLKMMTKAALPAGETLEHQLSPEVYANFKKHVDEAGLMMFLFDKYKPAMAALMFYLLEVQKLGANPEYGVDLHFYKLAQKESKPTVGLETVEFQIGLATDFTKEEGEMLMKTTLEEVDNTRKQFGEMMSAWKAGDALKLEELLNEAERQSPPIYRRLVTDRNRNWIPKIEEFLAGGRNTMVIVGAGHLVGNEGVVELLRKKGLKVRQL